MHEEMSGHKEGTLPPIQHCTAFAAVPPDTGDGNCYVGQNWDWMESVYGLSSMLLWKRPEGPSLLTYSYPGLWVGAGLNSAGVALCWTWGDGLGIKSPRIGIPAYVLIAQMLYQDTLEAALAEVQRSKHAGWFAFVLADGKGHVAAVDGTPEKLIVQKPLGHTARASYACREILGGTKDEPLKVHPQCRRMFDLLDGGKGKLDRGALQGFCADHKSTVCKHPGYKGGFTVDSMLFNCTTKEAHVSRGPGCSGRWQTFTFAEK
jgi:isopenicillin-N N-acyltransferase-like protein